MKILFERYLFRLKFISCLRILIFCLKDTFPMAIYYFSEFEDSVGNVPYPTKIGYFKEFEESVGRIHYPIDIYCF